jgi:hypothetical protein
MDDSVTMGEEATVPGEVGGDLCQRPFPSDSILSQYPRAWDKRDSLSCGKEDLWVDAVFAAADAAKHHRTRYEVASDPRSGHVIPLHPSGQIMTKAEFDTLVACAHRFYDEVGSDDRIAAANADRDAFLVLGDADFKMDIEPAHRPGTVYVITDGNCQKIGKTLSVQERLRQLSTGNPARLSVLLQFPVADMVWVERALHLRYAAHRVRNEWFQLPEHALEELKRLRRLFQVLCLTYARRAHEEANDGTLDANDVCSSVPPSYVSRRRHVLRRSSHTSHISDPVAAPTASAFLRWAQGT